MYFFFGLFIFGLLKRAILLSPRSRAEGAGYKATSPILQGHTLSILSMGHGSEDDPQRGKEAYNDPGTLRLWRDMKVTRFLNM